MESDKVINLILRNTFHIVVNANDFFAYACADAVEICPIDLRWIIPIVQKYEHDGLFAAMAYIENQLPLKEYRTKQFIKALRKIKTQKPWVFSKIDEWTPEMLKNCKEDYCKENDDLL